MRRLTVCGALHHSKLLFIGKVGHSNAINGIRRVDGQLSNYEGGVYGVYIVQRLVEAGEAMNLRSAQAQS